MQNRSVNQKWKVVIFQLRNICLTDVITVLSVDGAERLLWNIEMENKRLKAAKTCKICLEADIGVVFIPCGHVVCCHGCASLISRCSICEAAVRDTVKIYMN